MNNNDIVIRLKYALSISDPDMMKIFNFGGLQVDASLLHKILQKQAPETARDQNLTMRELEQFMNGLIISQRGIKRKANGEPEPLTFDMQKEDDINNVVMKKLKIAMHYTSEDYQSFFKTAGIKVSNAELSAVLRRSDHRNYRPAGDRYLRNLLKGMGMEYHTKNHAD